MKVVRRSLAVPLALVALSLALARPNAAPQYSAWSQPQNLGAMVNSVFNDTAPSLSKNGLSLYFSSNRPCGVGDTVLDLNIWVTQRADGDAPWQGPSCLDLNVDGVDDSAAAFSRDGHWMFFVSGRPGGLPAIGPPDPVFNARDLWVSWRPQVHDDAGWTAPINGGAVNSNQADAGPTYFEGDETSWPQVFFTSNRHGTFDIWRADFFGDGTLSAATKVDEVSTNANVEARPSIRHDGLELFFFGGPMGLAVSDIFVTTRSDTTQPWAPPQMLAAPVNTAANDQQPSIAPDRMTLYFASNRPGSVGLDLWVSTRTKGKP